MSATNTNFWEADEQRKAPILVASLLVSAQNFPPSKLRLFISYVVQYRAEDSFHASAPHCHAHQLADQHLVLAVVEFLAFPRSFALLFVLLPAVDLALLIAEIRPRVASAAQQFPRRSSFGLAGEARMNWHRGRAGVV